MKKQNNLFTSFIIMLIGTGLLVFSVTDVCKWYQLGCNLQMAIIKPLAIIFGIITVIVGLKKLWTNT